MQFSIESLIEPLDLLKLLAAVLIGGLIGAERERYKKAVGLRTIILITVGSCLFTILSPRLGRDDHSARIAAQIVSGIGFLGAGVILKEGKRIIGMTTAATIWLAAALGMACGAGEFVLALVTMGITLLVLLPLNKLEDALEIATEERTYEITTKINWEKFKELKALFKESGLRIESSKQEKKGSDMICTFVVYGDAKKHDKVVHKILEDKDIKQYWY